MNSVIVDHGNQGCALRNVTRKPKVPDLYEIQGAQHKAYMKEIRLSGRRKAKVSRLRHPGALGAQPWKYLVNFLTVCLFFYIDSCSRTSRCCRE